MAGGKPATNLAATTMAVTALGVRGHRPCHNQHGDDSRGRRAYAGFVAPVHSHDSLHWVIRRVCSVKAGLHVQVPRHHKLLIACARMPPLSKAQAACLFQPRCDVRTLCVAQRGRVWSMEGPTGVSARNSFCPGLAATGRFSGATGFRAGDVDVHVVDAKVLQSVLDPATGSRPFRLAHVRVVIPKLYAIGVTLRDRVLSRPLGRATRGRGWQVGVTRRRGTWRGRATLRCAPGTSRWRR